MEPLPSDKPDIQGERILWHVSNLGMATTTIKHSLVKNLKEATRNFVIDSKLN